MAHKNKNRVLLLFSSVVVFATWVGAPAQSSMFSETRIESEYKLAVPENREEALWEFLQNSFSTSQLQLLDTNLASSTETETFIDQYFDTPENQLLHMDAGVRFRQRFLGDSLVKKLVQLKLPASDSTGVVRREIKFDIYDNIKKKDRQAMHPFYRFIRPGDRGDVNHFLSLINIQAKELRPALKMKQLRSRVYISENGVPLMTLTLDRAVSAYFPYPSFTEVEMELNEIRYTEGDSAERERMEGFNAGLKKQILTAFPDLRQDQMPKYNKMHQKVSSNMVTRVVGHLPYILLATIAFFALLLFLKTELRNRRPTFAR